MVDDRPPNRLAAPGGRRTQEGLAEDESRSTGAPAPAPTRGHHLAGPDLEGADDGSIFLAARPPASFLDDLLADPHRAVEIARAHIAATALHDSDDRSLGADPARPVRRINPSARSQAMETHFAAIDRPAPGRAMMCATAALQITSTRGRRRLGANGSGASATSARCSSRCPRARPTSQRLVAAYDDAQGVTAAFDKYVLAVINRDLDANFDVDAFEHLAVWDADNERIEMRLRSTSDQVVHVRALDLEVHFARGESIRTEISSKFRRERVVAELAAAGLTLTQWWTDPAGDFALSLSVPA